MPCTSCGSENLRTFKGAIAVRLPELEKMGGPPVWIFPELVLCLVCNASLFAVPAESQRELVTKAILTGVEK
jgi:uncharacterized protein with PIN domain